MIVTVMMFMFVRVAADFHVATAAAAAAFLTHKILVFVAAVCDRRNVHDAEATLTERRYSSVSTAAISSSRPRRSSPLTLWHRGHSLKKSTHSNSAWHVAHQHAAGTASISSVAPSAIVPWHTTSNANRMESGTTPLKLPMRRRNFRTRARAGGLRGLLRHPQRLGHDGKFVHGSNVNVNRRRAKIKSFPAFDNFRLLLDKRRKVVADGCGGTYGMR